jgi:hypothetical protein
MRGCHDNLDSKIENFNCGIYFHELTASESLPEEKEDDDDESIYRYRRCLFLEK